MSAIPKQGPSPSKPRVRTRVHGGIPENWGPRFDQSIMFVDWRLYMMDEMSSEMVETDSTLLESDLRSLAGNPQGLLSFGFEYFEQPKTFNVMVDDNTSAQTSDDPWTHGLIFGYHDPVRILKDVCYQVEANGTYSTKWLNCYGGHGAYIQGTRGITVLPKNSEANPIDLSEFETVAQEIPGRPFDESFASNQTIEYMSDWVTPNYKKWESRGIIENNPCTKIKVEGGSVHVDHYVPIMVYIREKINSSYVYPIEITTFEGTCYPTDHYIRVTSILPLATVFLNEETSLCNIREFSHITQPSEVGWASGDPDDSVFASIDLDRDARMTKALSMACEGQLELLITALEAKQTGKMLVGLLHRVITFLSTARRLRRCKSVNEAKRVLKRVLPKGSIRKINSLAQAWLEYRYGWRQLWFDIKALAQVMKNINESSLRRSYALSASYPTDAPMSSITGDTDIAALIGQQLLTDETLSSESSIVQHLGTLTVRCGCGVRDPKDNNVSLAFNQLLGGINPTKVWWETVPLSFVIDKVVDIGALAAIFGVDPKTFSRIWVSYNKESQGMRNHSIAFDTICSRETNEFDVLDAVFNESGYEEDANLPWRRLFEFSSEAKYPSFSYQCNSSVYTRHTLVDGSALPVVIPVANRPYDWQYVLDLVSIIKTQSFKLR